jgi:hypothetical protein
MNNKKETVRSRMFIFADYTVTEEYEDFMQKIRDDVNSEILEEKENFDMQGTLTKIVTYKIIEDVKEKEDG